MSLQEHHLRAILSEHGEPALRRVVAHFYRLVPDDPVLMPMYPADDLAGAEMRLADFVVYRLGGPTTYIETRGLPRLRMRHAPFAIDAKAREHWLRAMTAAIHAELEPGKTRDDLLAFLGGVAKFLINR
jgi:hemoglobin